MKHTRLACMLLYVAMPFFFASCGGGGAEKQPSADTTAADTTKVAVTPKVTTITTPENMMVATHKVSNYAKWLASYDAHDSLRLANGLHSHVIGRGAKDSNTVMVAVKVDGQIKSLCQSSQP
jgi:hypothetical protein